MTRVFNKKEQTKLRRRLRNDAPKAERVLWSKLKGKQVEELKFRRQYSVGEFVMDMYCPAAKLAIEVDGETHFEPIRERRDERRQAFIESFGIRVLRFTNPDVYQRLDDVMDEIWHVATERAAKLKRNPPVSPLGKGGGYPPQSPLGKGGRR